MIQNGVKFFTQLAQTLRNPDATKNLVEYITQKDESGKIYLKIPVENEEVISNTLQTLAALFGAFIKQ